MVPKCVGVGVEVILGLKYTCDLGSTLLATAQLPLSAEPEQILHLPLPIARCTIKTTDVLTVCKLAGPEVLADCILAQNATKRNISIYILRLPIRVVFMTNHRCSRQTYPLRNLGHWFPRTLVPSSLGYWFPRTLVPQDISSLGHWFPRTLVPQDIGSLGHQFPRTLVPQDISSLGQWFPRVQGSQDISSL